MTCFALCSVLRATNTAAAFALALLSPSGQTAAYSIFCEFRLVISLLAAGPRDRLCVVRLRIDKCCYKREVVTGHSPLRGRGAQSAHSTRSTPNDARVSGSEARTKKPLRDREFAFAFAHPCNPHTLNDVLEAIDQQRKVLKILQFILSYMLSRSICHISESYYWWHAIEPTLATSWLPPITSGSELPCFNIVFSLPCSSFCANSMSQES